tara:strand:- start:2236 stop:2484 length:249 start_codon:yes stop_codon:yes gene_type:complete
MNKTITIELIVDNNTERDHRILQEGTTIENFIEDTITNELKDYGISVYSTTSNVEELEEEIVYVDSAYEMSRLKSEEVEWEG